MKRNLKNKKMYKLTAIEDTGERRRGNVIWKCICECGNETKIEVRNFGKIKSCGICTKHRMSNTPTYKSWHNMKQRCLNENHKAFKNYGKRGITVCERWMKFENFLEDMGERPSKEYSIERIDNNKGYNKSNCIWILDYKQNRNKKTTKLDKNKIKEIKKILNHKKLSYSKIGNIFGVSRQTVYDINHNRTWEDIYV